MHLADYLPLLTIFHLLCTEEYKISYKCRLSTHSFIQVMQAHLTSSVDNYDTLTEMLIGKKLVHIPDVVMCDCTFGFCSTVPVASLASLTSIMTQSS